jgi:hypothetical protein
MRIFHTYVRSVKNKRPADTSRRPVPEIVVSKDGTIVWQPKDKSLCERVS